MTQSITQLPIHECKDWNLHVVGIKDQYCTIRYDIYNKWYQSTYFQLHSSRAETVKMLFVLLNS
jgi:hypothetical protein